MILRAWERVFFGGGGGGGGGGLYDAGVKRYDKNERVGVKRSRSVSGAIFKDSLCD